MVILNTILILIGSIICFGGIYLKRLCAFFTGLIWGGLISVMTLVFVTGSLWTLGDKSVILAAGVALLFGVISAIFEKACVFLNSFTATFFILSVCTYVFLDFLPAICIAIALAGALMAGFICYKLSNIAYMLETAFTGALITSVGIYGFYINAYDIEDIFYGFIWGDTLDMLPVVIGTVVLGIAGFCVQLKGAGSKKSKAKKKNKQPAGEFFASAPSWYCTCGTENAAELKFCDKCGKRRIEANNPAMKTWNCRCGSINGVDMITCPKCGINVLQVKGAKKLCSFCGAKIDDVLSVCPECGGYQN